MLGIISSVIGFFANLWSFLTGKAQRDAGRAEQKEEDQADTIATLKREEQAEANAPRDKAEVIQRLEDGTA